MHKKVVLIASAKDFAASSSRYSSPLAPPMALLCLGSYLTSHDVPVELLDVQMDFGLALTTEAAEVVCQRVVRHLCDEADRLLWIGISEITSMGNGVALACHIHAALPEVPIIFGGYFPSTNYERLLLENPAITAIVRSDGEDAALQISRCLAQGRPFPTDQIPNLAWREGGEVRTSPFRPVPLTDLPILDFTLLHHRSAYQLIDLVTSRGCPFKCTYCLEKHMRPYATYAPEWVAAQLEHLETLPELPDNIFVYDPVFGLSRKQALEMSRVMGGHRFSYTVESRVDVLHPEVIPALQQAGVEMIYFGLESASTATLLRMQKVLTERSAGVYLRKAREVLAACFEHNVTPLIGFMLNFPGDTEADYQASAAFVQELLQLHQEVTARTGVPTGFLTLGGSTIVFDGSVLAEQVRAETVFPHLVLQDETAVGTRNVLSASPEVDPDLTYEYQVRISAHEGVTPLAAERQRAYAGFSLDHFVKEHPEVRDAEQVIIPRNRRRKGEVVVSEGHRSPAPAPAPATRRFRLYNVGIPKTGTTSVAALFRQHYRAAHEYQFQETVEHVTAWHNGTISPGAFRAFLLRRDVEGTLEVDSSSFNHYYLDILIEEFPDARFVFTVRDCYSWLDSYVNMLLRWRRHLEASGTEVPRWQAEYGRLQFGTFDPQVFASAEALRAHLPDLADRFLQCWGDYNRRVLALLALLPQDRTLILRTSELSAPLSLSRLADLAGVPVETLAVRDGHGNRAPQKLDTLKLIGRARLEQSAARHCLDVMGQLFPEPAYHLDARLPHAGRAYVHGSTWGRLSRLVGESTTPQSPTEPGLPESHSSPRTGSGG